VHHWIVFTYMLAWMFGPLAVFALAPRKGRDPYLWVFAATLAGPPVALAFAALPRAGRPA
jgi:hypothetical protein